MYENITIERVCLTSSCLILQDVRMENLFKILLNFSSTDFPDELEEDFAERRTNGAKCLFHSAFFRSNASLSAVEARARVARAESSRVNVSMIASSPVYVSRLEVNMCSTIKA
jgi:hypothetical protein